MFLIGQAGPRSQELQLSYLIIEAITRVRTNYGDRITLI